MRPPEPDIPLNAPSNARKNPADVAALFAHLGDPEFHYHDFSSYRRACNLAEEEPATSADANATVTQDMQEAAPSTDLGARIRFWLSVVAILPPAILLAAFAGLPLAARPQVLLTATLFLLAIVLNRCSRAHWMTLLLICLSMFVTLRYAIWRTESLFSFLGNPSSHWNALDLLFMLALFGSELYAFLVMALGYLQMLWPLRRKPAPMPEAVDTWPDVDVLIPTYNEPLEVVRYTALAAANLDWPASKLHVYILDDCRRDEFRIFAQEAGLGYITRPDNRHAKAGNINHALQQMDSPFVVIFDCDHAPTRSFLQTTMGWFFQDARLGMLQTPHHFYSPDPFERNLQRFRDMPNEGELFYGIIQDCNDFWNATFFCGSCAVLRRSALDAVGGIATETITEDAHTSLRMQMAGWNTAYINVPQAAGLASERLSGHVKQRIRWARGMIQVLRTDNPLFAPGLNWPQRLCYFNAMLYFLYALPRLIFLTGPLVFLLFGHINIPGSWSMILAYALPHLALSVLTNSRIQGERRHSFWNEVYETVLAPYILLPTLLALVNPRFGKFQVTDKGGVVEEAYFDVRIAQPFLVLFLLNVLGLALGAASLLHPGAVNTGTVLMNSAWTLFNMMILGVSMAVAYESQQRRHNVRIEMPRPLRVQSERGGVGAGRTENISGGGAAIYLEEPVALLRGDKVSIVLQTPAGETALPARVLLLRGKKLRVRFDNLSIAEQEQLTLAMFSRADTWLDWSRNKTADHPLSSLAQLAWIGVQGVVLTLRGLLQLRDGNPAGPQRKPASAAIQGMLLLAALAGLAAAPARAQQAPAAHAQTLAAPDLAAQPPSQASTPQPASNAAASEFQEQFTLRDLGVQDAVMLRGVESSTHFFFALPQTDVATSATLQLRCRFSPSLLPALSHVSILLNGSLFAVAAMPQPGQEPVFVQTLTIPAELLAHTNELSFEFIGHYAPSGEDPSNTALWLRIDPATAVQITGTRMPLANDLRLLPVPFFDPDLVQSQQVPIVFASAPSPIAMQAAGVFASWIGVLAGTRAVQFPVTIGSIPTGNAVVLAVSAEEARALGVADVTGPTAAMRVNPSDPYGKILVLAGANAAQMLQTAQAVALNPNSMQGDTLQLAVQLPAQRQPDDAPRWLPLGRKTPVQDLTTGSLQTDGYAPMQLPLCLPPDLYPDGKTSLPFYLHYRYNPMPLATDSSINLLLNGNYIGSVPLPQGNRPLRDLSASIGLPVSDLQPFQNMLSVVFYFQLHKAPDAGLPINQRGALLPDSSIDLRGVSHWAALPDLALFASAGFPFTRRADLSTTTVLLPATPTVHELERYLDFLGRFGGATGYPALRITVAAPEALGRQPSMNYLILGTMHDQPALQQLAASLPVQVLQDGLLIHDAEGLFAPVRNAWWKLQGWQLPESGADLIAGGLPDAILEAIQSPYQPGRSIVVAVTREDAAPENFAKIFSAAAQDGSIAKSVSVLRGDTFSSVRLGGSIYFLGHLPLRRRVSLWSAQYLYAVVLLILLCCLLLALWMYFSLRARAARRVQLRVVQRMQPNGRQSA
jgi:cellulose synthase (UDP-forming)